MKVNSFKITLATIACILLLASYVAFYYCFYEKGIKLNELYFLGSSISTAIFTGLLVTFFNNKIVRILLLYVCTFYVILVVAYVWSWVFNNHAYLYIKFSLIVGLIIGSMYAAIDTIYRITNKRHGSN